MEWQPSDKWIRHENNRLLSTCRKYLGDNYSFKVYNKNFSSFNRNIEVEDGVTVGSILKSPFNSEEKYKQYIISNIHNITENVLGDEFVSLEEEVRFDTINGRCDLLVVGKKKHYLIELKNPKWSGTNLPAMGQILHYGAHYPIKNTQLVIMTSGYDFYLSYTIKHYKLPIRYIYLGSERTIEQNEYI